VGIVRHHQFLNSADLPVDELAQLGGAVALSRGDSAAQEGNGQGAGHVPHEPTETDRL